MSVTWQQAAAASCARVPQSRRVDHWRHQYVHGDGVGWMLRRSSGPSSKSEQRLAIALISRGKSAAITRSRNVEVSPSMREFWKRSKDRERDKERKKRKLSRAYLMRSLIATSRRGDRGYVRSIFAPGVCCTWFILLAADFPDARAGRGELRRSSDEFGARDASRFQRGHVDHVGRKEKCEISLLSPSFFLTLLRVTRTQATVNFFLVPSLDRHLLWES